MPKYLFAFGFESPETISYNNASGDDWQSSEAVFITAESKKLAHEWGRRLVDAFLARMFSESGLERSSDDYANWMVDDPSSEYEPSVLGELPCVDAASEDQLQSVVETWLESHSDG